ncbi:MAG: DUF4012 domain-containing protein [Patescibacteria group bacterium]|jgi:hypothetical protein|nr:DUF4012 domain-containing protein [Patescibacteria group bacterium]
MSPKKKFLLVFGIIIAVLILGGFLFAKFGKVTKRDVLVNTVSVFGKAAQLLPIKQDTKKEIEAVDKLTQEFTKEDNIERRFLLLLQNNMELRPGGGFLGQYAVVKIKNGEVTSLTFEDANLLDQRITAKINPPYPFERMMSIKKWKFRDSNFSPDFPTNVDKAEYFYRLAGGNSDFDGVIAVNATTFERAFDLTGSMTINGIELNSDNAILELEELVEKKYILNPDIDTQNRKSMMKSLAVQMVDKLANIQSVPKLAEFGLSELRNKDVMLHFENEELQKTIEEVHWGGKVATEWDGDYLMMVDANMGALKSDYYIDRKITYEVDLTGEKPIATAFIDYTHNATYGDWRTSDYHTYMRLYVPEGSTLLEREMVSYPNVQEDFGKTYFGFTVHVLINRSTHARIKYELPESVREDYRLLIQKQSGTGDVPVTVKLKTSEGEFTQEEILKKDLKFEFE